MGEIDEALLERYLAHLAVADATGALGVATSLVDSGTPVDVVVERLVCAAQVEVGRRWERNEWSVAQEHAATAVSETVLDALVAGPAAPAPADGPVRGKLAAVCVEGEWHTLALRAITALVRRGGWDITFLGPSVPAAQLARYLHDAGPDGLLVSCSVPLNLPGARRVIEASRDTGTPVLAGGRGFGTDGRRAAALGADEWAPDALTAVGRLSTWQRFTSPAAPLTHPGHREHQEIERRYDELVDRAFAALGEAFPPVRGYTGEHLDRTREDLRYLFRFLSAALLVDDVGVLGDYVRWLDVVLTSRSLPPSVVPATVAAVRIAVEGDLPVAAAMLRTV